ncbi:Lipocalin-like domain-containing protein [Flavobacterium swingsii]|uniref:Lipocalin-like domain-containing protein n=1 Tax=Flavobacterium swingsii TaxID=498292 RepID=A0A1I0WE12_9FLAO|nr:lipocalin family protein [Flavobacterium swingsii]SFA86410.1 Lipocalin-like domain-containing protein [Flavobacterium swingsii]
MKKIITLPICILYLMVLVSCTTDSSADSQVPANYSENTASMGYIGVGGTGSTGGGSNTGSPSIITNPYFGFLDGDGNYDFFIDMPIESSPSNLIIGRWEITKLGIDENNDGNIMYYNYADYNHRVCGKNILQFNNNGTVFENSYYNNNGICSIHSEKDDFEFLENDRLKIYVYDNIYIVKVTQTELVLKYDWDFDGSLYGPMQAYYYFDRIVR